MIQCQISAYPLGTEKYKDIINESIEALNQIPISYTVSTMSTLIKGDKDTVFSAVRTLFDKALTLHPELILIATYTSVCSK
jgi:uncharacterized protein YqgV (UPF0045/DUF77 family)